MPRKKLTEGYKKVRSGAVSLSGNISGLEGVALEWLEKCCNKSKDIKTLAKADVCLKPFDENAINLIEETFSIEYKQNDEGYLIDIDDTITIYADSTQAALYAVTVIVDSHNENGKNSGLEKALIYNYPDAPHRATRLYLPSKDDMGYFKKFIDLMVFTGYNTIWLEIGGAMEFKKHPEINRNWIEYCKSMNEEHNGHYAKEYVASRGYYRTKNSIHTYNGGGQIYSQDEMRELVKYCKDREIEIIPEVPSLTHSEYFLISYPELRECDDEPYAATACPSNPDLYPLVFDLYDEVIDVFNPKTVHIGHDEWWVMCVCDKCKDKDPARLFADNIIKCYDYLKSRGVRTMLWSDKTIRTYEKTGEAQGGCEKHLYSMKTDELIDVMGEKYPVYKRYWFNAPEEVKKNGFHQIILDTADCLDMLPKDIIHANWLWACEPRIIDAFLSRGLESVYANLDMTGIWDCKQRFKAGAKGVCVSNWIESTEKGFQHWDVFFNMGYAAIQCWDHTRRVFDQYELLLDVFENFYKFRNKDILNGKYLEVVHATEDAGLEGKKCYEVPYVDDEKMYLGKYVVTYTDNTTEEFPVLYSHNIGYRYAGVNWYSSLRFWGFHMDTRLTMPMSVCDIEKEDTDVWYKAVFPVKDKVASTKFVPGDGMDGFMTVKRMTYKDAVEETEKSL